MTKNIQKTLVFFGGAVVGLLCVLSILFWLGLVPGQVTFEHPFDVATAPDGRIVVADTLNNRIVILDAYGNFISTFGSEGNGTGEFRGPMGVTVSDEGNIFVVDSWNNRIQVFEGNGTFIRTWGSKGFRDGELDSPRYIAIAPDGDVVVSELHNRRIQIFDQNGSFKHKWGATAPFADAQGIYYAFNEYHTGSADRGGWKLCTDGQVVSTWDSDDELDNYLFSWPDGVAVDRQGQIVITDLEDNRLISFDSTGRFRWKTETHTSLRRTSPGNFSSPCGVAVTSDGTIFVADSLNNRIQKFTSTGQFLDEWKEGTMRGIFPVSFDNPFGVEVAPDGNVIVADTFNNRIVILSRDGVPVKIIGSRNLVEGIADEFQ